MPETSRLATTIETWWPAILVALIEQVKNARIEGFNRIIKQVKRVGCGFTNMDNYRRRIMAHIAVTRPRLQAAFKAARSSTESRVRPVELRWLYAARRAPPCRSRLVVVVSWSGPHDYKRGTIRSGRSALAPERGHA